MLKVSQLKELIRAVDKSGLTEFSVENDDFKVSMKKEAGQVATHVGGASLFESISEDTLFEDASTQPFQPQQLAAVSNQENNALESDSKADLHQIVSPMVGTFYAAPSPDADPYVKVGDQVSENTVVCIVEAMKLMNELEAEVKGAIVEILVENGKLVEYGQPLFLVKTE